MTYSMTGYAQISADSKIGKLSWELRSVNARFLEPIIRLPEWLRELEIAIKEELKNQLARGKVECTLRILDEQSQKSLSINKPLAASLIQAVTEINTLLPKSALIQPMDILRWPEVLQANTLHPEALQEAVLQLFKQGIHLLKQTRKREGDALQQICLDRLDQIRSQLNSLRPLIPQLLIAYRNKILERCADWQVSLDITRLEQEVALLAQRLDIQEEIDRIDTHLAEVCAVFQRDGAIGRHLDFLIQELNRETNTIGSKSNEHVITQAVVNMKVWIEQLREQIQNIE